MADGRRCHRFPQELPLSFEMGEPKKTVTAKTLNISATGFAFVTKEPVSNGQVFLFTLTLNEMTQVRIDGEIVWTQKKWQGVHQEWVVGVKVIDRIDEEKRNFVRYVATRLFKNEI
ncbi:MAG: PilZ domain-containing protein [Candidatus Omnitrophota bacterium]